MCEPPAGRQPSMKCEFPPSSHRLPFCSKPDAWDPLVLERVLSLGGSGKRDPLSLQIDIPALHLPLQPFCLCLQKPRTLQHNAMHHVSKSFGGFPFSTTFKASYLHWHVVPSPRRPQNAFYWLPSFSLSTTNAPARMVPAIVFRQGARSPHLFPRFSLSRYSPCEPVIPGLERQRQVHFWGELASQSS